MYALHQSFLQTYGPGDYPIRLFFAPGRVNLIGEHTDYNGGHVLPCALSNGTYMAIRQRDDEKISLYSENFSAIGIKQETLQSTYVKSQDWTDYVKAVLHVLSARGYMPNFGFDVYVYGNIPNGAGLSSSASLELVTLTAMKGLFGFEISPIESVKIARAAENEFIGVNCGIMDQFIIGLGKEGNAVLLDTETLQYEYAPVELTEYTLVIANTNKRRGLADSKYNERFSQCQLALSRIQSIAPEVTSLGALNEQSFEAFIDVIEDPVLVKRARHAVLENQRTLEAHRVLQAGELETFGKLMNASHLSLKEDYEVTGIELDTLVELSQNFPGVLGARMTGAGFGGCTVALVKSTEVDGFIASVGESYKREIGYAADFYVVTIGDGARELV